MKPLTKILSKYIKEQRRYTKDELAKIFDYDEPGVERFIKDLKAYGILKSVKNKEDEKELSDLVEEDIEISEETSENGECLYVFTYVGIITYGRRVLKIYPKYLSNETPLEEMKQVLKVLEKYNHSAEQTINIFNGHGEKRSFNLLAVILYLLKDYHEYGIYTNDEEIIETNGEGGILWEKTINDGFAIIEDNAPYYTELYTRKTIEDDADFFRELHEFIITDCSKQLKQSELNSFFYLDSIELSDKVLREFGELEYILNRIKKEIDIQFNTRKQILLKTFFAYLSHDKKLLEEDDGVSMYGTTAFHAVWEQACAEAFDNKLNVSLCHLKLSHPLDESFKDKKDTILKKIIDVPIWKNDAVEKEASDTLIPDLISIFQKDGEDYFYIFDAKYYLLHLKEGQPLRGNPGIGDVTKQYLYQLAYRKFTEAHHIKKIKNCFLLPKENDLLEKGVVEIPMLHELKLENIEFRKISAPKVFECYLHRKLYDISSLDL